MNDKLHLSLLLHLRAMWKYRWRGLFAAFGVAVVAAAIVFSIPKRYEASARIYANTDSILKPLMSGVAVQTSDLNQRVAMLSRVVINRPNIEHLVQAAGLDEKVKTLEDREKLIDRVMKVLEVQRGGGDRSSNIYVVKFRDTDPVRAKRVVELLVSMFIDTSKGREETDAETAKAFLEEQAAIYEKKLQDAESRLKEFKLRNMSGSNTLDGKDYFAQIATVSEQLSQAQLHLREAENSRDAYRRGLASENLAAGSNSGASLGGVGDNVLEVDSRIDAQKRNLDGLLQRYTENHPDVVGARRVIRELEEERRRTVEDHQKAGLPLIQSVSTGPRASEQIKVSLAQAEANVASLRARVAEYSARYRQLRDMARRMPEYEAELAQLNRDYEVNRKNYEGLISRRESANISGDMQAVTGVDDFRLIDPPRVPSEAIFPNRVVLLIASLVLALVAGAIVMFVSKEVQPCIYNRQQLRTTTELPILGVVSFVGSNQSRSESKRSSAKFAMTGAGLSATYFLFVVAIWILTKPAG